MPTATKLSLRVYNVRFGDCVLVSLETAGGERHVLFDFGNAPSMVEKSAGKNDVFAPIAADIASRTNRKLDLVVMSHEHLDHMEGFLSERGTFDGFEIGSVWMSVMSEPDYYTRFPDCEVERRARAALLGLAERWDARGRFQLLPEPIRALIANNVLALSNKERVDYVRGLAKTKQARRYLYRRKRNVSHPLGSEVKLEVLAPERRASVYYGAGGQELWLDRAARLGARGGKRSPFRRGSDWPPHMARDEFETFKDEIAELSLDDLLAIDKAANNTSLVVRMTVGGKVLLFPGDAEPESWAIMREKKLLAPVDVLKVAHHGSVNGMPIEGTGSVLDQVLKPGKKTTAILSTCRGAYGKTSETFVPHPHVVEVLKSRCKRVIDTERDAPPGGHIDFEV